MKLASLNCPNCNAPLREESGKFICTACGSAFTMDYDESDVEHEKLATEAERERIKKERDLELMATKIRLDEEAAARKAQRDRSRRVGIFAGGIVKPLVIGLIIFMVFTVLTPLSVVLIFSRASKSMKTDKKTTATTSANLGLDLSKEQVLGDEGFTVYAIAAAKTDVKNSHSRDVADWALRMELDSDYVPTAQLSGEPKLENVYFLPYVDRNYFYVVFSLTYTYMEEEIDRTTTVYCARYFKDIKLREDGSVFCDYIVQMDIGDSEDLHFYGYYDKDLLYKELIEGKNVPVIDLSEELVK
ncbi:MAG: hypothetical protein J5379_09260 [Clostridiales bacterium]|nr:hypothetical protein [Clostridiales bacterium]